MPWRKLSLPSTNQHARGRRYLGVLKNSAVHAGTAEEILKKARCIF